MPRIKHFNQIASIKNHLEDVVRQMKKTSTMSNITDWGWGITEKDTKEMIKEEILVCKYLIAYQLGIANGEQNIQKPTLEVVERCFNRHLVFLQETFKITPTSKIPSTSYMNESLKEAKCCKHYLFQFRLPAWFDKLPAEILTYENKYNKGESE